MNHLDVKEPFSYFKDNGFDIINNLRIYLERAKTSSSESTRQSYQYLCEINLQWLLKQYSLFENALASASDVKWTALNQFISYYATKLNLVAIPLPILGFNYFTSGSFSIYSGLRQRLQNDYYVISVDKSDSPLFWSLTLHEIFHCWLSIRDVLDNICENCPGTPSTSSIPVIELKVEETLCDALATYIVGPAYPYAYINKLWAVFPAEVSPEYPTHSFRLECMAKILEELKLFDIATEIRDISATKLNDPWEHEEIEWALDDIVCTPSSELPQLVNVDDILDVKNQADPLEDDSPEDLPILFFACWNVVNDTSQNELYPIITKLSDIILKILERGTSPSDALT